MWRFTTFFGNSVLNLNFFQKKYFRFFSQKVSICKVSTERYEAPLSFDARCFHKKYIKSKTSILRVIIFLILMSHL